MDDMVVMLVWLCILFIASVVVVMGDTILVEVSLLEILVSEGSYGGCGSSDQPTIKLLRCFQKFFFTSFHIINLFFLFPFFFILFLF